MRLGISSTGMGIESQMSTVFERCPYYVFVDIEGKRIVNIESIVNPAEAQLKGAEATSSKFVVDNAPNSVITGSITPKAFDILNQAGISVFTGISGSLKDNINMFLDRRLKEIYSPSFDLGKRKKPFFKI